MCSAVPLIQWHARRFYRFTLNHSAKYVAQKAFDSQVIHSWLSCMCCLQVHTEGSRQLSLPVTLKNYLLKSSMGLANPRDPRHLDTIEGRRNSVSGGQLQPVLVVYLASGVFGLFIFHRFEDWTAQHQADKLPKTL